MHAWVEARDDGWQYTVRTLDQVFASADTHDIAIKALQPPTVDLLELSGGRAVRARVDARPVPGVGAAHGPGGPPSFTEPSPRPTMTPT